MSVPFTFCSKWNWANGRTYLWGRWKEKIETFSGPTTTSNNHKNLIWNHIFSLSENTFFEIWKYLKYKLQPVWLFELLKVARLKTSLSTDEGVSEGIYEMFPYPTKVLDSRLHCLQTNMWQKRFTKCFPIPHGGTGMSLVCKFMKNSNMSHSTHENSKIVPSYWPLRERFTRRVSLLEGIFCLDCFHVNPSHNNVFTRHLYKVVCGLIYNTKSELVFFIYQKYKNRLELFGSWN
jgi:hypothetical protein